MSASDLHSASLDMTADKDNDHWNVSVHVTYRHLDAKQLLLMEKLYFEFFARLGEEMVAGLAATTPH